MPCIEIYIFDIMQRRLCCAHCVSRACRNYNLVCSPLKIWSTWSSLGGSGWYHWYARLWDLYLWYAKQALRMRSAAFQLTSKTDPYSKLTTSSVAKKIDRAMYSKIHGKVEKVRLIWKVSCIILCWNFRCEKNKTDGRRNRDWCGLGSA